MPTGLAGLRVLVVEDDAELRNLTTLLLEEEGADVRGVSTAGAALACLQELRPAVALLDSRLPDGCGLALASELRIRAPACAQVLVSGDAQGVEKWRALGGLALEKPFDLDDLLETVARAGAGRPAAA